MPTRYAMTWGHAMPDAIAKESELTFDYENWIEDFMDRQRHIPTHRRPNRMRRLHAVAPRLGRHRCKGDRRMTTLDSKAVAEVIGIEPKALRVFLRSGKAEGMFTRDGKAYVFTKADVAKIKKAYAAFRRRAHEGEGGRKDNPPPVVADESEAQAS